MLDLKITNATIVDGTGSPGRSGSIGVRDGRIVLDPQGEPARETIDAGGNVVSSGFVDVHTHDDAQICWDPSLSPSCYHGVTTVFGGNCGFSIAPLTPDAAEYLVPMLARVEGMPIKALREGVAWNWSSFDSYLAQFDGRIAINAGFLAGHSTIRRVVMGERAVGEKATEADLEAMKALLSKCLTEGALGFSSTVSPTHNDAEGLPVPSRHASRDELLALARVCRDHEGTVLELLPGTEFSQEIYQLLTDYSLAGGRPVNWNMLAVTNAEPDQLIRPQQQIEASSYARSKGAEVIALALAGPATMRLNFLSGFLLDAIEGWAPTFQIPVPERLEKFRDPAYRTMLDEAAHSNPGSLFLSFANWRAYSVVETFAPENKDYVGRTIGEIADQEGKPPFDIMLDIAVADELKTSFMPAIEGDDHATYLVRAQYWKDDRTVVGASDAGAHNDMIDTFAFSTKLLQHVVREHKVISLEEAIHQLTEVPPKLMGLKERGCVRDGGTADLVIFDPDTVACGPVHTRNDFPGGQMRLYAEAEGISHVIINGKLSIKDGVYNGSAAGTVLRSGRDTYTVGIPADLQAA